MLIRNKEIFPKERSRFSDDELNKKIRSKIGYLSDLKKKFCYDDEFINKLALMNVALKENYIEIDELFYNTLMSTEIFTGRGSMKDLARKHEYIEDNPNIYGLYLYEDPRDVFKPDRPIYNPIILVAGKNGKNKLSKTDHYSALIHEIRHALTSQIATECFIDKNTYYRRIGLYEILTKKGEENYISCGDSIDEAFNENATEILINTILSYKNSCITNPTTLKILKQLKTNFEDGKYYSDAYINERYILRELFRNETVMDISNRAGYLGKLNEFHNLFPGYVKYYDMFEKILEFYNDDKWSRESWDKVNEFEEVINTIAKTK